MGSDGTNLESLVNEMFDYSAESVRFSQSILREQNGLIKKNLVEMNGAVWGNHVELNLTDLAIEWLQEQEIQLTKKRGLARQDVLQSDQIPEKKLFFDSELQQKLGLIEQTLSPEHLPRIRERLQGKNMPEGISMLFYGPPGTGKTESVLQVARKTGRSVMWVDMSNTKSMFYGESEKKISAIFRNYKEFAENSETLPILLFNEADALFSTRNKQASSPVFQTENAIQNILLEKMEKFTGILMATTNLEGNLDPAFDRRFLYKVAFFEPDLRIRINILRDKIPQLEEASAALLAGQFHFSGGMIENLARKCEMYEILNGQFPNSEELLQFAAEEESMRKKDHKPIGFMPAAF
jgi:SpoVK/Ycf46/Vps4 family AAA+-type ATPase